MIKYFIWLILFFPSLLIANINQPDDNAAKLHLTQLLQNITIMNANFTQTVINKSGYILQEQAGTIQLAKPNLLNWEVLTPDHMLIVSDGRNIWNYDIDLEQVTVKNFSSEINNAKIASLLLGDVQKIFNNFQVIYSDKKCDAHFCFELNSHKNSTEEDPFVKVELGFNKAKQLIIFKMYDQLEQETIFHFTKFKNKVDPKVFKFTVPEGVDLIKD